MYACGLRIGEAVTLEIGAIDSANLLLRIIGKGNKQRLVPLPPSLLIELRNLWRSTVAALTGMASRDSTSVPACYTVLWKCSHVNLLFHYCYAANFAHNLL
jgi:site-specific recombinase XerD